MVHGCLSSVASDMQNTGLYCDVLLLIIHWPILWYPGPDGLGSVSGVGGGPPMSGVALCACRWARDVGDIDAC